MMSSRRPCERPSPGVIGKSLRAANSIDSLLPTIGIQIGGRGRCTGRGQSATSLYDIVRPEDAVIGEDLLGPRPGDDVERLLEASARLRQRHVVDPVLARDATG